MQAIHQQLSASHPKTTQSVDETKCSSAPILTLDALQWGDVLLDEKSLRLQRANYQGKAVTVQQALPFTDTQATKKLLSGFCPEHPALLVTSQRYWYRN